MRVRKKDQFHGQLFLADLAQYFTAIGSRIEDSGLAAFWIPDEIRVDPHAVVMGGELRESLDLNFFRMPCAAGEIAQGSCGQAENGRDTPNCELVKIAFAKLVNIGRIDACFFREFSVGNAQTALRFANNVANVVFERNHCASGRARLGRLINSQIGDALEGEPL